MITEIQKALKYLRSFKWDEWSLYYPDFPDGLSVVISTMEGVARFPPFKYDIYQLELICAKAGYHEWEIRYKAQPRLMDIIFLKRHDIEIPVHVDFWEYKQSWFMSPASSNGFNGGYIINAHLTSEDFTDGECAPYTIKDREDILIENRFEILDFRP